MDATSLEDIARDWPKGVYGIVRLGRGLVAHGVWGMMRGGVVYAHVTARVAGARAVATLNHGAHPFERQGDGIAERGNPDQDEFRARGEGLDSKLNLSLDELLGAS